MGKEYVDQAVQTEPPRYLSRSENPKALHVHSSQSAYSRPHHPKKASQLGQFSKPSEVVLPTKRVVSLPESSPPHRLKPTGDGERLRVSMSEMTAVKMAPSADSSVSSECFETSVSLDTSHSSDIYSNRPQPRSSLASLAFPHTPSPPSSPESSIMIIGNNVQVSSSFLHPKPKTKYEDKDWAIWADSPPRPIPALHGPLSLPYARCPSGAEGTLVEGEDVSRMVWGLREDEPLPLPPRTESLELKTNASKESPSMPFVHLKPVNQSIHQLKSPPSIASNSPAISLGREYEVSQPSTSLITPRDFDLPWCSPDSHDDSPIIIPPTPQQLYNFLELQRIFGPSYVNDAPEAGLGLFWTGRKSGSLEHPIPPRLQASAPVFVPHSQVIGKNPDPPLVTETADPPRRCAVSAVDFACLLHHQAPSLLPTPPSSTTTKWIPRFPGQDALMSDAGTYHTTIGSEFSEGDLHEPTSRAEGLSLHDLTSDAPQLNMLVGDTACMRLDHGATSRSHSTASSHLRLSSTNMAIPPSPQSPEFKLNTHPQPRSIPFARLLQRRLSAVPEEESSLRLEPSAPGPRLSQRRPGFQNGAQAPNKPYFAQAAHSLPDISNKAHTSPSDTPPKENGRRSRVPSTSTAVCVKTTGSCPTSPTLKQKVPSSKENTSIKAAESGNKVTRKRGRNRAKKQDSAAVGAKILK